MVGFKFILKDPLDPICVTNGISKTFQDSRKNLNLNKINTNRKDIDSQSFKIKNTVKMYKK